MLGALSKPGRGGEDCVLIFISIIPIKLIDIKNMITFAGIKIYPNGSNHAILPDTGHRRAAQFV